MSRIFFSSDWHGYHVNIAGPKVSKWKDGYRNFDNEIEMTEHFIKNINNCVKHDDILYYMGDWSFGNVYNIKRLRDQIHCRTIHLMLGNHDQKIRENKEVVYQNGSFYPQDLFTSVQDVLEVKHGNHTFFMSHYAHRVWSKSHRGYIHLYGHSHDNIPDYGKSIDIGIDVAKRILGEYRPFSIEEIISIMDKKEIKSVDHHIGE